MLRIYVQSLLPGIWSFYLRDDWGGGFIQRSAVGPGFEARTADLVGKVEQQVVCVQAALPDDWAKTAEVENRNGVVVVDKSPFALNTCRVSPGKDGECAWESATEKLTNVRTSSLDRLTDMVNGDAQVSPVDQPFLLCVKGGSSPTAMYIRRDGKAVVRIKMHLEFLQQADKTLWINGIFCTKKADAGVCGTQRALLSSDVDVANGNEYIGVTSAALEKVFGGTGMEKMLLVYPQFPEEGPLGESTGIALSSNLLSTIIMDATKSLWDLETESIDNIVNAKPSQLIVLGAQLKKGEFRDGRSRDGLGRASVTVFKAVNFMKTVDWDPNILEQWHIHAAGETLLRTAAQASSPISVVGALRRGTACPPSEAPMIPLKEIVEALDKAHVLFGVARETQSEQLDGLICSDADGSVTLDNETLLLSAFSMDDVVVRLFDSYVGKDMPEAGPLTFESAMPFSSAEEGLAIDFARFEPNYNGDTRTIDGYYAGSFKTTCDGAALSDTVVDEAEKMFYETYSKLDTDIREVAVQWSKKDGHRSLYVPNTFVARTLDLVTEEIGSGGTPITKQFTDAIDKAKLLVKLRPDLAEHPGIVDVKFQKDEDFLHVDKWISISFSSLKGVNVEASLCCWHIWSEGYLYCAGPWGGEVYPLQASGSKEKKLVKDIDETYVVIGRGTLTVPKAKLKSRMTDLRFRPDDGAETSIPRVKLRVIRGWAWLAEKYVLVEVIIIEDTGHAVIRNEVTGELLRRVEFEAFQVGDKVREAHLDHVIAEKSKYENSVRLAGLKIVLDDEGYMKVHLPKRAVAASKKFVTGYKVKSGSGSDMEIALIKKNSGGEKRWFTHAAKKALFNCKETEKRGPEIEYDKDGDKIAGNLVFHKASAKFGLRGIYVDTRSENIAKYVAQKEVGSTRVGTTGILIPMMNKPIGKHVAWVLNRSAILDLWKDIDVVATSVGAAADGDALSSEGINFVSPGPQSFFSVETHLSATSGAAALLKAATIMNNEQNNLYFLDQEGVSYLRSSGKDEYGAVGCLPCVAERSTIIYGEAGEDLSEVQLGALKNTKDQEKCFSRGENSILKQVLQGGHVTVDGAITKVCAKIAKCRGLDDVAKFGGAGLLSPFIKDICSGIVPLVQPVTSEDIARTQEAGEAAAKARTEELLTSVKTSQEAELRKLFAEQRAIDKKENADAVHAQEARLVEKVVAAITGEARPPASSGAEGAAPVTDDQSSKDGQPSSDSESDNNSSCC